jgi:hypothetical protein
VLRVVAGIFSARRGRQAEDLNAFFAGVRFERAGDLSCPCPGPACCPWWCRPLITAVRERDQLPFGVAGVRDGLSGTIGALASWSGGAVGACDAAGLLGLKGQRVTEAGVRGGVGFA